MSLRDRTLFITGASRGIGKAIALRAARDGARIAVVAKTKEPHPKLPGTVFSACEEIEAAGGQALPCIADIRFEEQIDAAVKATVERFGGIDILVNNASAISLNSTLGTDLKRYDLMHQVNARGTFACSRACIPHLERSDRAHILTLSPPPTLRPEWFSGHVAYTVSKYAMSLFALGMAEELRSKNIGVNCLWPRTMIATSAVRNILGEDIVDHCRKPEIMGDAAHHILSQDPKSCTGRFFIDEEALKESGIDDLSAYAVTPGQTLSPDLFVE
jgi:citronellol/citronellal dehydrogenase